MSWRLACPEHVPCYGLSLVHFGDIKRNLITAEPPVSSNFTPPTALFITTLLNRSYSFLARTGILSLSPYHFSALNPSSSSSFLRPLAQPQRNFLHSFPRRKRNTPSSQNDESRSIPSPISRWPRPTGRVRRHHWTRRCRFRGSFGDLRMW